MRILAVTPYYEPEGGGLERYAHEILHRMVARGHEVRVVAQTMGPIGGHVRDGVRIDLRRPLIRIGNAPIDPGLGTFLREIVEAWAPDIIVGHGPVPYPAEVAADVAHRMHVPFVLTYHSGRLRGSNVALDIAAGIARKTMEERMFARSARIIAVSGYVRDHALYRHLDKVTVIPPGVDRRFRPAEGVKPEILFVAPLSRRYVWKGVDVLIKAFAEVRSQVPGVRLHLVGDGNRRGEFEALAAHDDSIIIDRRLDDDSLISAYQHATVLALPSTTDAEAFGMVLAEANACGRPVVASRIGGIPDFVSDGDNGLLVPPKDPAALAASMIRLLQDPQAADRIGDNGRRLVREAHDWDDLTASTLRVLEDACARP